MSFKKFGNTYKEIAGNLLTLLLFSPVIISILIFFTPVIIAMKLWSIIRKEPRIIIPNIKYAANSSDKDIAQTYVDTLILNLPDIDINHQVEEQQYLITSKILGKRIVNIEYGNYGVGIDIDDLNNYDWNTIESKSIDLFFWVAVAALQNGVYSSRTRLGRKVYWTKSQVLGVWLKVQNSNSSYDGIEFYLKPPPSVLKVYEDNKTLSSTD